MFTKKNVKDIYRLSPLQEGMFFHSLYDKSSSAYFEQAFYRFQGNLQIELVEKSLNELIKRYDILRTVFIQKKSDVILQVVLKERKIDFHYENISGREDREEYVRHFREVDRKNGFDLSEDMLMRLAVFQMGPTEYEFIWSYHHILMDGWCGGVIIKEYFGIYNSFLEGRSYQLPPVKPYRLYIDWLEKQDKEASKLYWKRYLEGYEKSFTIPKIKASIGKTAESGYKLEHLIFKLDREKTDRLKQLTHKYQVTLSTVIHMVWGVISGKYYGQQDAVFGTVVSGRPPEINDVETMVGLFINTIPVRILFDEKTTLKQLLQEVQEEAIASEPHHYISLAEIQAISPLKQDLIDVLMGFQNYPITEHINNVTTRNKGNDRGVQLEISNAGGYEQTNYDLNVVILANEQLKVMFKYNGNAYDLNMIEGISKLMERALGLIIEKDNPYIYELTLLSEEDKDQILYNFIDNKLEYSKDKPLQLLFEDQVERNPDRTAVVYQDEWITYGELNRKSNQLARRLKARGVTRDRIVGIMVERSIAMIVGIMGILKSGGAYLPIDPKIPGNRVIGMLEDAEVSILLSQSSVIEIHSFTALQNLRNTNTEPHVTAVRPQVADLDSLSIPDRSLVDYEKYNQYIGAAPVKVCVSLLATRGCPYDCAYCHKIWPKKHNYRSAENLFEEVLVNYKLGIRKITIVDDIFNLNVKNSRRFFQLIIENGLDVQLFFTNGLRGDLLTKDYIDLMVKAGTKAVALALETASPRLQKLIRKNLNLEKLRKNLVYIAEKYPHVVLELQTMIGFPTETEEELRATLDFIKNIKWIDFPYLHVLKIYPGTDMEALAIENGVPIESILKSEDLAYHEIPETLPFEKERILKFQTDFLNEYFLSKERLLDLLPYQMKLFTEDELVQKYNTYLPTEIKRFNDLLQLAGIKEEELAVVGFLAEESPGAANLNERVKEYFPSKEPEENALKILLLDLSLLFSSESHMLYDVVEQPLGLMYLMTYLNRELGEKVNGTIAKSRVDFDSYSELKELLDEFKPDLIGIRTLSYFKDFFHKTVAMIRQWGIGVPIISGGPYATSNYQAVLSDPGVDLVVLGEGEITFRELVSKFIENNGKLPDERVLKEIAGIAYVPGRVKNTEISLREIIIMDHLQDILFDGPAWNLENINQPEDLAYVIYTSGSTGIPKGSMVEHRNVNNLVVGLKERIYSKYGENLKVSLVAPYVFDPSVQQIFAALLLGHGLYIVPEDTRVDGEELIGFYRRKKIEISDGTPAHLSLMLQSRGIRENTTILNIKHLLIGGEALPQEKVEEFLSCFDGDVPLITNLYGPAECCVDSTSFEISRENISILENIPIGKPMPNEQVYILAEERRLQPVGAPGELCIGGDGVSRGYLKRAKLTEEKFVENPFVEGERLYRTGDLARLLPDGNIEFLGRLDRQVKIRGFRVELEEIERWLLSYRRHINSTAAAGKTDDTVLHLDADIRCSRCLLPSSYPGIRFNEDGVCNICREYDEYKEKARKYFKTIDDFLILVEKARRSNFSDYDCLLLFSGGKDSSYVLYRLVELGLKVLAFTFDNGYISQTAFENIKRETSSLNVDNIVCKIENMKEVFVESLNLDDTVCTGCFRALTTLSTQLAFEKGINMIVTGLSRGQIFDTKLYGLFQQKIFDVEEIEAKLLSFRKIYHSMNDKISRSINIELDDNVFNQFYFVDFFRYEDISAEAIKDYLKQKDIYWSQPGDTGFCSTNCIINDVGIYMHLRNKGYHNYAAPLSWEYRLGQLSKEEIAEELHDVIDEAKVIPILNEIGYLGKQISDAVVVDKEDDEGSKYLAAYIVPTSLHSTNSLNISEIKDYLAGELPAYMIPTCFVPLEEIPKTPNGKIDRKALPDPKIRLDDREYAAPRNEKERKLVEIWSEVLNIDKDVISIDDNFFELGGHSLKTVILIARIHKELNVKAQLEDIFKRNTVRAQAELLKAAVEDKYIPIERVEEKEYYVLSSAQKRLYLVQRMAPQNLSYNLPQARILGSDINKGKLEDTFKKLINRNENLRTSFQLVNREPFQRIHDEVDFAIDYFDFALSGEKSSETIDGKIREVINHFVQPFDLGYAPLFRVGLINTGESRSILIIDMHHIITDGISMDMLIKDFFSFYNDEELPELPLQYKDYAHWQTSEEYKRAINKQEEYWLKQFEGNAPIFELPMDYPRPIKQSFEGDSLTFEIGKKVTASLNKLAKSQETTLYTVLLTLFYILLARLSGQEDIVIGTFTSGRRHANLEQVMGMFVNTLALRSYPELDKTFIQFLQEVKEGTLKAFENQDYPFEELVEKTVKERRKDKNPIFDVMFGFQNFSQPLIPEAEKLISGRQDVYEYENKITHFDLLLIGGNTAEKVFFNLEYCIKLFKEETIERMIKSYLKIVDVVTTNNNLKIKDIDLENELISVERISMEVELNF